MSDSNQPNTPIIYSSRLINSTWFFMAVLTCLFIIVAARLIQLQYFSYQESAKEAARQVYSIKREQEKRGSIVDRNGRVLAVSLEIKSCALDPEEFFKHKNANPLLLLQNLEKILSLTPNDIQRLLIAMDKKKIVDTDDGVKEKHLRFVWVKRKLSSEELLNLQEAIRISHLEAKSAWSNRLKYRKKIEKSIIAKDKEAENLARIEEEKWRGIALEAESRFAGVMLNSEFERFYPGGKLAAHVLGFTDIDGNGLEGIEKRCNSFLQGGVSEILVARDARSKPLSTLVRNNRQNASGLNVELTIDSTIQTIAEEELEKVINKYIKDIPEISGSVIVVNPNNGDILAMGNYPNFDANNINDYPAINRRNNSVASVLEPGSTFKPFIIATALQEKVSSLDDTINSSTYVMSNGRVIKDIHPYGTMSLLTALIKSSNPAMVKTALKIGDKRLYAQLKNFGFSEKSGCLLSGELSGRMTDLKRWSLYTMGSVPMGYEINVTPLQMAMAYSAIANGGLLFKPRIVRAINDQEGNILEVIEPTIKRRVLSPDVSAKMRYALRKVITEGTGRRANIQEYSLAGKTGTAELLANAEERRQGVKGYSKKRHAANFTAIVPWDKPQIVVYVVIKETTKYGGEISAPVVREISRRVMEYLNFPHNTGKIEGQYVADSLEAVIPPSDLSPVDMVDEEGDMLGEIDPRLWEEWVEDDSAVG